MFKGMIKNKIIAIACVVTVNSLYGMEVIKKDDAKNKGVKTFVHPKFTKIVVVQDDIYNRRTNNAYITVVGENEQIKLQNPNVKPSYFLGSMIMTHDNYITRKNKILAERCDSPHLFDEETVEFIAKDKKFVFENLYARTEHVKMKNNLLFINEPELVYKDLDNNETFVYTKQDYKQETQRSTTVKLLEFYGREALEMALIDLGYCYKVALQNGLKIFSKEVAVKSIAFPLLSVWLGIPGYSAARSAVEAVIRFLKENQNKDTYDSIELVMPDLENFNLYKTILNELADKK